MELETISLKGRATFPTKLPYDLERVTSSEFGALKQAEAGLLRTLRDTANDYWRPHFAGVNLYMDFEPAPGSDTGSVHFYVQRTGSRQGFRVEEDTLAGAFWQALRIKLGNIRAAGRAS